MPGDGELAAVEELLRPQVDGAGPKGSSRFKGHLVIELTPPPRIAC
ncbi:MAG TPA: hypothetical protein VFJ79_02535 [Acidimicrobiales bacterium]|nr:hypothetical protein [Acidimicrobiales bacterium]